MTDPVQRGASRGGPPLSKERPPAADSVSRAAAGEPPDLLPAFAGAPPPARRPLRPTLVNGTRNGLRTFLEMSIAMVPAYLFALLLEEVGAINTLSGLAEPLMGWLGLPGSAALPILLGCLLNLYAAIGAMSALALTPEQITVLAVLLLISHNLIVEGAVVQKAGMNGVAFSLLRLLAGFSAGAVVHLLMGLLS